MIGVFCVYIYTILIESDISVMPSQANVLYNMIISFILTYAVLHQFSVVECFRLWHVTNVTRLLEVCARNETTLVMETTPLLNETTLTNFTYTLSTRVGNTSDSSQVTTRSYAHQSRRVDCFGLGETVAATLEWFFRSKPNGSDALDVQFFLSSRKQPHRVQVVLGEQFGLEWTDFKIERRTVVIVHGFLSHGQETWIRDMEEALLEWVSPSIAILLSK